MGKPTGQQAKASAAQKAQKASTRTAYGLFRDLARARFKGNEAAYDALSLRGKAPQALNAFVTHARSAYATAAAAPYAADLARRGYTAERLDALTRDLDALVDATKAATVTRAAAKAATKARNRAATAARAGFAEYRDTARPVLGPLAGRLGL